MKTRINTYVCTLATLFKRYTGKDLTTLGLALLFSFTCTLSQAATLEAYVDRNKIKMGEVIEFTIELNKKTNRSPNLKALKKKFKILRGPMKSKNTSTINGSNSSYTRWTLEITPKETGTTATIPSVSVGSLKTYPISIKVIQPPKAKNSISADKPVFIRSEVNKLEAYIQEQIMLTVKVFHRVEFKGKKADPEFPTSIIEPLGDKKEYRTNIDGVRYSVTEWTYAIFPQQAEKLVIAPYILEGTTIAGRGGFFIDKNTKRLYEKTQPISINIKEKPTNYPATALWLPAKQVTLEESWSPNPPLFKVGEPVTRTITLRANQQRSTNLPKQPNMSSKFFKIYPDQTQSEEKVNHDQGIQSIKIESLAIVPTKAGEFRLPEITIHWWNTKDNKLEVATIPEKSIIIAATTERTFSPTPTKLSPDVNTTQTNQSGLINGISPAWKALAIVMILLWIATLGLALTFWKKLSDKENEHNVVIKKDPKNLNKLSNSILQACRNHDPEDAKYSLIDWGSVYFNAKIVSIGELSRLSNDSELTEAINGLQTILYGDSEERWHGDNLAEAIETVKKRRSKKAPRSSALVELHPAIIKR